MARLFKLSISLKKKQCGTPVYHKQDGQRFAQPQTVKLNQNTDYIIRVAVRPPMKILGMIIQGEQHEVKFDEEKESVKDCDNMVIYVVNFNTTGYECKRKDISMTLQLEDGLSFTSVLQCKFYKEDETDHSRWGQPLTWIEYECQVLDDETFVNVLKEKYL